MTNMQVYIDELYETDKSSLSPKEKFFQVKNILECICKEITNEEVLQFPTFFSRLVFVSQKYNLPENLEWQLQNIRVKSKQLRNKEKATISQNSYRIAHTSVLNLLHFIRGEASNINIATSEHSEDIPSDTKKLRLQIERIDKEKKQLMCICEETASKVIVQYGVHPSNDVFDTAVESFWERSQINVIDYSLHQNGTIIPEFIVLEPDYLIDASAIAACFQDYCISPLLYFLNKFEERENKDYLLLGNLANFFLDELVYAERIENVSFKDSFFHSFKTSPFEYTACDDIKSREDFKVFMQKAKVQFENIRRTICEDFSRQGINVEDCTLEPSFFSEKFGFQGRLDLLSHTDKSTKIIELKSGKLPFPSQNIGKIALSHEVQTAVYRLMIESVYGKTDRDIHAAILYSAGKNSGENLRFAAVFHQLEKEIVNLRNHIIINEYQLVNGDNKTVETIFESLFSLPQYDKIPSFFEQRLQAIEQILQQATDIERSYFYTYIRFISRELYLQKIGDTAYETSRGVASLWNTDFEDRLKSLDVIAGLSLIKKEEINNGMQLTFLRNEFANSIVNFREGDICIVYPKASANDSVLNKQILKGTIASITPEKVEIYLRYKQRNETYFAEHKLWAIEHDTLDSSYNSMFRSLFSFLKSTVQKRNLLLGLTAPEEPKIKSKADYPENIIENALTTKDYFLIVGPPGTGKTSIFAKRLIEKLHKNPENNILVLAYTNRAVDELCEAIHDAFDCKNEACNNYLRVGTELSCDEKYREQLLQRVAEKSANREELRNKILNTRIFVSTVASITGRQELFSLKKFDIAIIDEASQILEPQLIGLLTNFEKFILIGDHNQLSTIVLQKEKVSKIQDEELNKLEMCDCRDSLFERLLRRAKKMNWDYAFSQLTHQGRMHANISLFPATYFYENNLFPTCDWQNEEWGLRQFDADNIFQKIIANNRTYFFSTEERYEYTPSPKINETEAEIIVEIIQNLKETYKANDLDFNPLKLGIIAPYRNQIALIKHKLAEAEIENYEQIVIDTVERFQGSQRDIIILSFCVSKPYQLNFLCNLNREGTVDRKLNVALTRARQQLFVVGNARILSQHPIYASFLEHYKESLIKL